MIIEHNREVADPADLKVGRWFFKVVPSLQPPEFLCKVIKIDKLRNNIMLYSIPKDGTEHGSTHWVSVQSLAKVVSGIKPLYKLTEEEKKMVEVFEKNNPKLPL